MGYDYYPGDDRKGPGKSVMLLPHKKVVFADYPYPPEQILDITNVVFSPASAIEGQKVNVTITVKNMMDPASNQTRLIKVAGEYTAYGQAGWPVVFENSPQWITAGQSYTFRGYFYMPSTSVMITFLAGYFVPSPGNYWLWDTQVSANMASSGGGIPSAYSIPSNYIPYNVITYPASGVYSGDAERCIFAFNAPLTIIPGVTWLVDKLVGAYICAVIQKSATPLELMILSRPGSWGSTDYIVVATAYSNVAAMTRGNARYQAPIAWAVIGVFLAAIIGLTIVFSIKAITTFRYGPTQTTTTTTQPVTTNLSPGQSQAVISGSATVTAGPGGATVTTSSGTTTTVPPGGTATVGPGSTVVAGSGGASVTTAPQTTTVTGPSNPSGAGMGEIVKYVAILGGVLVGGALILSAISAFKK